MPAARPCRTGPRTAWCELGTVWLSTTYDMLNELAARYNVDIEVDHRPLRFFPTATLADDDEEVHAFFPYTLGRYSLVEAAEGVLYFWKLARQYPFLAQPGFQVRRMSE